MDEYENMTYEQLIVSRNELAAKFVSALLGGNPLPEGLDEAESGDLFYVGPVDSRVQPYITELENTLRRVNTLVETKEKTS